MPYILNLYSAGRQLYLNKTGRKNKLKNKMTDLSKHSSQLPSTKCLHGSLMWCVYKIMSYSIGSILTLRLGLVLDFWK